MNLKQSQRLPLSQKRFALNLATALPLLAWTAPMMIAPLQNAQATTLGSDSDFKFPALLCVYRYSVVSEKDGVIDLYGYDTGEQALRIKNVRDFNTRTTDPQGQPRSLHIMTGETSAEFSVPETDYRFRFNATISQGLQQGRTDELRIRTYLEKKDPSSGEYLLVGQKTTFEQAEESPDGSVQKNVYARASNHELDSYRNESGQIDQDKVFQAIQEKKLTVGALFNAGPVCGLMDMRAVKNITSHPTELAAIIDPVINNPPSTSLAHATPSLAPAKIPRTLTPNFEKLEAQFAANKPQPPAPDPKPMNDDPDRQEFEKAYPELAGQQPGPATSQQPPSTAPNTPPPHLADMDQYDLAEYQEQQAAAQQEATRQQQELAAAENDARLHYSNDNLSNDNPSNDKPSSDNAGDPAPAPAPAQGGPSPASVQPTPGGF